MYLTENGAPMRTLLCLAFIAVEFAAFAWAGGIESGTSHPSGNISNVDTRQIGGSTMKDQLHDLFDRWERVWHEGQYDLVPSCVGPNYIRHDEAGNRTVTRDAYAAEIAKTRQEQPGQHGLW